MNDRSPPGDSEFGEVSDEDVPTPILFKLMVVLTVIYLLYRLGEGVVWLFQALS